MSQNPNILWICVDQQRWDCLGYAEKYPVKTPNIDRLAAGGVMVQLLPFADDEVVDVLEKNASEMKSVTEILENGCLEDLLSEPIATSQSPAERAPNPAPAPASRSFYRKTPEQWYAEVGSYDKHKCGKPFICSCCGQSFSKNQGYRIDFKEIYFCFDCKKKIYKPSNKGWRGSVISIPMGNKR